MAMYQQKNKRFCALLVETIIVSKYNIVQKIDYGKSYFDTQRFFWAHCSFYYKTVIAIFSGEGGYSGCSTDVLAYVDAQCSGWKSCLVNVRKLVDVRPCKKDFMSYMEASYTCVDGKWFVI